MEENRVKVGEKKCFLLLFLKQYSLHQKHLKVIQEEVARCTYVERESV